MKLADAATDTFLGNSPERWLQAMTDVAGGVAVRWVLRTVALGPDRSFPLKSLPVPSVWSIRGAASSVAPYSDSPD